MNRRQLLKFGALVAVAPKAAVALPGFGCEVCGSFIRECEVCLPSDDPDDQCSSPLCRRCWDR